MLAARRMMNAQPPAGTNGIYAIGGFTGNGTARYDLTAGTWNAALAAFPAPSQTHDFAIGTINGKIYVAGGYSGAGIVQSACYEYNPASDTWTTKASMSTAVEAPGYAVLNSKLYVVGGDTAPTFQTTVQVYDPAGNSWSTAAALPVAWDDMVCGVISGKLYAASGSTNAATNSALCYEYDPGANTWTAKTSMTTGTHGGPFGDAVAGKLYVIGGETQNTGPIVRTATVQVYNPATNTWGTAASLPTPARELAAACEANGKLYVHGGYNGTALSNLYVYDPATDVWTTLTGTSGGLYGHGLAAAA